MTNSWNEFVKPPGVAIHSGPCANVIADSTRWLQQCVQEQLNYLDKRARALATSARFEAALKDATRMQQLNPCSAAGYLCAGHVRSLQGREKAAIEIYDQGLAVVPLSDPSYQQLVDARSMAQAQNSRCIDFIKEFPVDIIENIASTILTEEAMAPSEVRAYLGVSHEWQEKLLQCSRWLHVESTTSDDLAKDDALLEQVAPYCTGLTLGYHTAGLTQLTSKAQFPSLRTLIARDPWDRDDYKAPQKAIDSLFSLGSTLTHLDIDLHGCFLSLGDILSNFPHLVHLETYNVVASMDTAPECHPRLKTLQFWQHGKYPDIHDIVKRLPALEIFVTYPFHHSRDVKVLEDNCPNLKIIACDDHTRFLRDISTTNHDDTGHIGVHTVHIGFNDGFTVDSKDLMEFMIRNNHSIQNLFFHASSPYIHDDHRIYHTRIPNHATQPVCLSRMTTYSQSIYGEHDMLLTRWIASKSPHLKKLELIGYIVEDIDTSGLFDDLIGFCELETLKISLGQLASIDMTGIERFIRYQSTIDSQLHTLTLPKNTRLSNDALDALATLPRLENLTIDLPLVQHQDSDGEHFSRFIHKLALGCPQLKHLDISSEDPIPDKIILRLSELSVTSLYLDLFSYKTQMPMSLLSLLQCPRLQKLHIIADDCDGDPNKDLRDMLNSKIDVVTGI